MKLLWRATPFCFVDTQINAHQRDVIMRQVRMRGMHDIAGHKVPDKALFSQEGLGMGTRLRPSTHIIYRIEL